MSMTHHGYPLRMGEVAVSNVDSGQPGVELTPLKVYDIVPATLSTTAVAAAQAVAGAGNATINGASASGGVATFDFPRCAQIVSSNAGDTTQTVTLYGTDAYGVALTETITANGTTPVIGVKAFKTITRAAVSAALTGNLSIGNTDKFGLPIRVTTRNYLQTAWNGAFVTTGTLVGGDTTSPATAVTTDVRGTYAVPDAANGTKRLTAYIYPANPDLMIPTYGVTQA